MWDYEIEEDVTITFLGSRTWKVDKLPENVDNSVILCKSPLVSLARFFFSHLYTMPVDNLSTVSRTGG